MSDALRKISSEADPLPSLKKLALSIDGPLEPKENRGNGGESPPTATLLDVGMSDEGSVTQDWGIYANGQKVSVKSTTDKDGDVQIEGKDLEIADGLSAQQAVAFILHGAHPRYYPKPGKTVVLDKSFINQAANAFG